MLTVAGALCDAAEFTTAGTATRYAALGRSLAVKDDHGRKFLAPELIALADLVAAHPEEFRQAMADEAVLTTLVKGASR